MCLFHDATPTWSGFNYQGKLALFHTLKIMNSVIESDYEKYELELEWFEDFAIKKDGRYKTIHQVKAYNTNKISKYNDAIWGLFRRVLSTEEVEKGYLHTWKDINCKWSESVKNIVEENLDDGDPNIKKLSEKIYNINEYEKLYKDVHNKRPGRRSDLVKFIYEILGDNYEAVDEEEFKELLLKKIHSYSGTVEMYKSMYTSNTKVLDKIVQYEYGTEKSCNLEEIRIYIEREIIDYYKRKNETIKADNEEYIENVYMHLLGLIDRYIVDRHNGYDINRHDKQTINFKEIDEILNKDIEYSEKFYIYKLKERIQNKSFELCNECSNEECMECNIRSLRDYVDSMKLNEFKEFCCISSPNIIIKDEIDLNLFSEVIPSSGLGIYLDILNNIKNGWEYKKVLSHNKTNLLTTVTSNRMGEKGRIQVSNSILENKNIHEELMEYKVIISNNVDIDNLINKSSKINHILDEELDICNEEFKGHNINRINKIAIKSAEKYLEEVND